MATESATAAPVTGNGTALEGWRKLTEDQLLKATLDVAKLYGWHSFHVRPARTEKGWRSPVQGDGKGFPDLVLAKRDRLIFAELKGVTGTLTREQWQWRDVLEPHAPFYVWRPSAWESGDIASILKSRAAVRPLDPPGGQE
jgi:hypothetical protein